MMTAPRQAIVVPDAKIVGNQVLVVEDSTPIRELLANFLVKGGMVVTSVGDGTAAIQILERNRGKFDLIVTDLCMPGADGFAVLMEAKRSNPGCAVVICTGYATLDSAIQAVRVGAYDYVPKPFKPSDIQSLVDRLRADSSWRGYQRGGDATEAGFEAPVAALVRSESDGHFAAPDPVGALAERVRQLEARLAAVEVDGIPTRS